MSGGFWMKKCHRPTWAEIDLSAIANNIKAMQQRLHNRTRIMAVVKADAYGHGAVRVAEQALEAGASALAVALLEEALELREAGIKAPILVFGWVAPEDTPIAAANHLTLTCFQKEWLQDVAAYTFEKPLNVHMKWDTGMGRVGIRTEEELHALLECLKGLSQVKLTGVYTHFSTADEADLTHFNEQRRRFNRLLTAFQKQWEAPVTVHTGNSAAAMRFPEHMYHYVRFGIGMYGLYPSAIVKNEQTIALQPAFSLHSRLVHVKKVAQNEPISYGATYRTPHPEWIGTVPIGYADGWARKLQGMDVLIDGQRMPITGRICMDQLMVRLDREYPVGTKVTLIGKQGDEQIGIDEVAEWLETINYEIPCMITARVPKLYR